MKKARMSGQMSDTAKNRAAGLIPYANQPMRKGGVGPELWHGVSNQRWGLILPTRGAIGSREPAPGRDVRRAKGIPKQAGGKKIEPFVIEDRPKRNRV